MSDSPMVGQVVWAPDGTGLFYTRASDGGMVRAAIQREPSVRVAGYDVVGGGGQLFTLLDIHPDGSRLLGRRIVGADQVQNEMVSSAIVVVANWFTELRARLGEDD